MPLYSLPCITEQKIAEYLQANYSGSYPIVKAFSADAYSLPMVLVKAGKFQELEPQTDVYEADLAVSILTQADDVAEAVATHDLAVASIYDLLRDTAALFAAVNLPDGNFHIFSIYSHSYDQEHADRALVSIMEYKIYVQTMPIA